MSSEHYHLIVIGGGINGVGVAQAGAAAGYRVLLLEKNSGLGTETSACSSKLIHGGLRYLETFEIALVYESLRERTLLLKLAPDLVKMQQFNIPLYRDSHRSALILHTGLSLYALLAGAHNPDHRYRLIKQHRWPELDGLSTEGLRAVFQYQDAQTDDAALTQAVMASATSLGAELHCDAEMLAATLTPNNVEVEILHQGRGKTISCDTLVNATGPWVSLINQRIQPTPPMAQPDLVQGTHLEMKTTVNQAYYLEAPQDGRAVFLLPWKGHSLLGTTEHLYTGDPAEVHTLQKEKDYLLEVLNHYFPDHDNTLLGEMAGLRVLPGTESKVNNPLFKRSRETMFEQDNPDKPRVVSIVGGKLTVYRRTALEVIKRLQNTLPEKKPIADTATLALEPQPVSARN